MANLPVELQGGENVAHIAHRHIVYLILHMFWAIVGGVVPVILLLIATSSASGLLGTILLITTIVWALGGLVVIYFTWYRYQNDIWIITNQRLIDSTKFNWFNHRLASTDLVNVEDMTVERKGIIPTMFNFGDLRCQTAGAQGTFTLKGIPAPQKVLDIVDQNRDAARRELGIRPGARGI